MQSRDPMVKPTPILDLRPTQITVGMREVAMKQREWRKQGERSAEFLGRHMIPVVIGPKKRPYIVDHHHLVLALHQEGVAHVLTTTVSDISHLEKDAFWVVLDFMRRRIKRSVVEKDFQRSLKTALAAAKTPEARYLPGWCGPLGED